MNSRLTFLAAIVAGLTGAVTFVLNSPEIVLKVPNYGFILYHLLGGPIPSFMDIATYPKCIKKEACPWLNSNDVVVSVCGKCGTNWVMTMVHELRTWNLTDLKEFEDIHDVLPWAEMKHFPGQRMDERIEYWGNQWNDTRLPFKAFKAHGDPRSLPVIERPDIKYIACARKAEDALLSGMDFFPNLSKELSAMIGGFPPKSLSLDDLITFMEEGTALDYYEYFKRWYIVKSQPNVLFLHYSDVFKDPRKYIEIVAKFLGLQDITKEGLDTVERRTSIEFMKSRGEKYMFKTGRNKTFYMLNGPEALVNKGGVGRGGRAKVTEQQRQRIKKNRDFVFGENKLLANLADDGFDSITSFKK